MSRETTVEIDGSHGEGGGQILRTSLALAAITGRALSISKIRANRPRPGLLRQHLTGVKAMAEICKAEVVGAELGSDQLYFAPRGVTPGDYHWQIGSAGSTSLVLQTVMFPLLAASRSSRVRIEGGTHNGQSPSFEFLDLSLFPLLELMGFAPEINLARAGFYPAGGGVLEAALAPSASAGKFLELCDHEVKEVEVYAWSAGIPDRIGKAEVELVGEALGIPEENRHARMVGSNGPGNVVSVIVTTTQGRRAFTSFGEPRLALAKVAEDCIAQVRRWMESGAAVDEHLQDQLLLPLCLAKGGKFTTTALSEHSATNVEVIKSFLPVEFAVRKLAADLVEVEVTTE